MDGKIIIGTEIDDKGFDKQYDKLQLKAKNKKIEIDLSIKELSKAKQDLDDMQEKAEGLFQEYQKTNEEIKKQEDLISKITTKTENGFTIQQGMMNQYNKATLTISDLKAKQRELEAEYSKMTPKLEKQEGIVEKINTKYEKQKNQLKEIGIQINDVKQKQEKLKLNNMEKSINNVSSSLGGVVKKVTKWSLALLGIRSVYNLIRNAVSQAVQENETMSNQIQYINYAIGTALKPILEFVLNIIYKIIAGIGAIIKLITGVNIFSKATAKNFANANKSAGGLKKTLAGFDEMDIVGGTGGTGLLGDIGTDLGNLRDLSDEVEKTTSKMREWFKITFPSRQQIEETYKPMREFWGGIANWFDETVINPMTDSFKGFAEVTEPLWKPVADGFKEAFGPLYNYVNENFLQPLSEKLSTYKDNFLSKYAKFINKIIYFINFAFGAFGVNLEYIDEESAITGKDIEKNIGNALDTTKTKAENFLSPLEKIGDKLKELTSKAWDIVTNFTSNGLSKSTMNNWLQPLRDNLSKMGIKLPYLAKGGIVNMPSRGVPVGNAIAGERGAEGVIPLTDSQQMALLGEAIGKYITINANIVNTMNGRVISKELQRVQNDSDFAYNR